MSKDLLFEIGTEEIPAGFMAGAFKNLKELAQTKFEQNRIETGKIKVTGTPRRLALYIEDVATKQSDLDKEIRGPAKNIAFDDDGNPTKAATGFAKGQGLSVDELEIRDTDNGEYVFAATTEHGQPTEKLLGDILAEIVLDLNFPKTMRWADKDLAFIRPIRWLLALYGEQNIELEIAGVKSDSQTRGHRFLGKDKIEIPEASDYFKLMEEQSVIVDHKQRKEMILKQIEAIEAEKEVEIKTESGLLSEVIHLIEYPTALCGEFEAEFLELPDDVLITSMREHQRYFPVYNNEGELKNLFVTVRNGDKKGLANVREGNEKVLRARLADAKFFYQADQESDLEAKVEELKDIIFHEGLGSIYDKVVRMQNLVADLGPKLNIKAQELNYAKRTAYLSKADLVTEMVNEFAKLQGVMGREYALLAGENGTVAQGIFEHYLPRYSGDQLPTTNAGRLVSIIDKIDNIVACFNLGLIPTGSQDPYALRRQAQGIIDILLAAEIKLPIKQLLELVTKQYKNDDLLKRDKAKLIAEIIDFFELRLEKLLESKEIRYDVISAVLATEITEVNDLLNRAQQFMKFRKQEGFSELITAFERVSNLAKKKPTRAELDSEQFVETVERKLYDEYLVVKKEVEKLLNQASYQQALAKISTLKTVIDEFFNQIMVMVDDEKIRNNRLALLDKIASLAQKIADLTKIVVD